MEMTTILAMLFSVLIPSKTWYNPNEPLLVKIDSPVAVSLVAIDFLGQMVDTNMQPTRVEPGNTVDLRKLFSAMSIRPTRSLGTYIIYAVPDGKSTAEFVGTPLLVELRGDSRPGAPPGVIAIKVEPLCLARIHTNMGPMTLALYYDSAPNTVANFIGLSRGGFYEGLTFHRIVPGFIAQAGSPLGDDIGGPGYSIQAEFNDEQHREGVISMARERDPLEQSGIPPRQEYADTAGSQFFICLDYARTQQLDKKYTAFGRVVEGIDTVRKIGGVKISDPSLGRPEDAPIIQKIEIIPVTAGNDPYPTLMTSLAMEASTQPVVP